MVFGWFWGCGTSDTRLARRKLGKKNTPQPWRPPSSHGRHGAPPPAPPHTTISQHAMRQVYVVKTSEYNCFYYLLAISRQGASSTRHCVCRLRRLSVIDFRRQTVLATVLWVFVRRFRAVEPGRAVMGCRYCRRRKPCWYFFL